MLLLLQSESLGEKGFTVTDISVKSYIDFANFPKTDDIKSEIC